MTDLNKKTDKMLSEIRAVYLLFVVSVIYLDLIFPINIPYVRLLIITNFIALLTITPAFRRPRKGVMVYIILLCLLVFSFVFTESFYNNLTRDVANIVLISTLMPMFYTNIKTEHQFFKFKDALFKIVFFIGVFVGLIGFYKFYFLTFTGSVPAYFITENQGVEKFRIGTSLVGDYNYYALGLFFSLSTIPFLIKQNKGVLYKTLLVLGFLVLSSNIFMSGSRRGVLLIVLYLLVLLISQIRASVFRRHRLTKRRLIAFVVMGVVLVTSISYTGNWISDNQESFADSRELEKLFERAETLNDADYVMSERTIRWRLALNTFANYNPIQFIMGDGFDYLVKYGRLSGVPEDYPHNYLLSALLYGGALTFGGVLLFTGLTFREYAKSRVIPRVLLMWFVLGVFMLLTSKNSMFSVQFILFLFLFPYFKLSLTHGSCYNKLNEGNLCEQ